MSNQSFQMTDTLYAYLLDQSLRESDLARTGTVYGLTHTFNGNQIDNVFWGGAVAEVTDQSPDTLAIRTSN